MPISSLINRAATIIRRSEDEDDDFSDPSADPEGEAILVELQQQSRNEPADAGEMSDTSWVAFFLPDAAVHGNDVLIVDGFRFEFIGEPWLVRDPRTGQESHIEASLRRTAGPGSGS